MAASPATRDSNSELLGWLCLLLTPAVKLQITMATFLPKRYAQTCWCRFGCRCLCLHLCAFAVSPGQFVPLYARVRAYSCECVLHHSPSSSLSGSL